MLRRGDCLLLSCVGLRAVQVEEIIDHDLGHVFTLTVLVFILAVVELAGDGDLFTLVQAGGHPFGERPPGHQVVPGGVGDEFTLRVLVGFVGGQAEAKELFAGGGLGQFRILAQVTDQLDAIYKLFHDTRILKT